MKKLSEVTKLTGVSRRALQEYDRLDLVNPSGKTEAGYWLYDDEAIQRILFVQIFAEVGYERKQIKQMIDNQDFDIEKELKNVVEMLEEKRTKINGMINLAKQWQTLAKMPTPTLRAMGHANISEMYQNQNYSDALRSSINESAKLTDEELIDVEKYSPLYYHLLAIGFMKAYDPRTKIVQNSIHEFYKFFYEMIEEEENEKFTEEEVYSEEGADAFIEVVTDTFLADPETKELISVQCGEGAIEFIIKALKVFRVLIIKNFWKKTE